MSLRPSLSYMAQRSGSNETIPSPISTPHPVSMAAMPANGVRARRRLRRRALPAAEQPVPRSGRRWLLLEGFALAIGFGELLPDCPLACLVIRSGRFLCSLPAPPDARSGPSTMSWSRRQPWACEGIRGLRRRARWHHQETNDDGEVTDRSSHEEPLIVPLRKTYPHPVTRCQNVCRPSA